MKKILKTILLILALIPILPIFFVFDTLRILHPLEKFLGHSCFKKCLESTLKSWFKDKGHECTGVPELSFNSCCMQHDLDYLVPGKVSDRREADWRFLKCMWAKGEYRFASVLYYLGVRLLGWIFFEYN